MLSEVLLIAMTGVYNPMDMSGNLMYPSGVKEVDNYHNYAPEKSKKASFACDVNFFDNEGDLLDAGFYLASLSEDNTKILLFQNNRYVAVFDVIELYELKQQLTLPYINFEIINRNEAVITLVENNYMAKAKVHICK